MGAVRTEKSQGHKNCLGIEDKVRNYAGSREASSFVGTGIIGSFLLLSSSSSFSLR